MKRDELSPPIDRRQFAAGVAALAALPWTVRAASADDEPRRQFKFCVFEKFLLDLTYEELTEVVAEMGFVGIEATVRDGGHVQPERVRQDLPKLVNALSRRGLRIEIMATDVNDADRAVQRRAGARPTGRSAPDGE